MSTDAEMRWVSDYGLFAIVEMAVSDRTALKPLLLDLTRTVSEKERAQANYGLDAVAGSVLNWSLNREPRS